MTIESYDFCHCITRGCSYKITPPWEDHQIKVFKEPTYICPGCLVIFSINQCITVSVPVDIPEGKNAEDYVVVFIRNNDYIGCSSNFVNINSNVFVNVSREFTVDSKAYLVSKDYSFNDLKDFLDGKDENQSREES